jgi:hypothetical protein
VIQLGQSKDLVHLRRVRPRTREKPGQSVP